VPGYIRYSSPAIPFSIFVSVPPADERNVVARLAEAIIHEAMHLQLTLIEAIVPQTVTAVPRTRSHPGSTGSADSGRTARSLRLGVIFQALGSLGQSLPEVEPYGAARLRQISAQVRSVQDLREGLTNHGPDLWKRHEVTVCARR
jgi:hypothetical protein